MVILLSPPPEYLGGNGVTCVSYHSHLGQPFLKTFEVYFCSEFKHNTWPVVLEFWLLTVHLLVSAVMEALVRVIQMIPTI
jgi:hypothetical protein